MKNYFAIIILSFMFSMTLIAQDIEAVKDADPVTINGSISSQMGFYSVSGINARSPQFTWGFNGNMNMSLYNVVDLPFSFAIGRYGNNGNYPVFRQFGISPSYKWVKLHLGHRNMHFSDYTLSGHTFLGAGVELNPGKFRFSAMYGRLRKAEEVDIQDINNQPTFKRLGYCVKAGVGGKKNHIDFILFKAKDDKKSLETLETTNVNPSENLVFGIDGKTTIFQDLTLTTNMAVSAFTRNQNISNEILVDSTKNNLDNYLDNGLINPNFSTRINFAGKAKLNYKHKKGFNIFIEHERIDPQYETMGAYFFANDLARTNIGTSFSLFKNKVSMNGNFGIQRNNLLGDRLETTRRKIGSANIDIHPNAKYGININFSNFSIYQRSGTQEVNDTIAFNMQTLNFGIVPRLSLQKGDNKFHNMSFMANFQRSIQEQNDEFQQNQDFQSFLLAFNYSMVNTTTNLTPIFGLNYHSFSVLNQTTQLLGATAGINKTFIEGKLSLGILEVVNWRTISQGDNGINLNSSLNLSYSLKKQHRLACSFSWLKEFSKNSSSEFSEIRGNVQYSYTFAGKISNNKSK